MKRKHQEEWLRMKQNWFDRLPRNIQVTLTRPGSVKTK